MRAALALLLLLPLTAAAQDAKSKPLQLLDAGGKAVQLDNWKIVSGLTQLTWLEGGKGGAYLEFREEKPKMYKEDVTTYIPLASVKRIEYDHKARTVSVTLHGADGKDITLRGSTEYVGINRYNVEGELSTGAVHVGNPVKLTDGYFRADMKGIGFPESKPIEPAKGAVALVQVRGMKEKTQQEVHDLSPLYRVGGEMRLLPFLMFQKTVKLEQKEITSLKHMVAKDKKGGILDFDVEKSDGSTHGLTLLEKVSVAEKESGTLVGLVGRVQAGYRLYPASVIEEAVWKAK